MKDQTTITVSGALAACVRALVNEYPGTNANRVGRALVRLGLRQALLERAHLVAELRSLDTPCEYLEGRGNEDQDRSASAAEVPCGVSR